MTSYTETTTGYVAISTVDNPPETNIKMLPPAAAAVDVPYPKGKKTNAAKKKKKRSLFMCCSNMQFENEEQLEKAMASLKSEKSRLAMVMCCSNFEVGGGHEKVAK